MDMIEVDMSNTAMGSRDRSREKTKGLILSILNQTEPSIQWDIAPIHNEDPEKLYIRGSYFSKTGEEFAAMIPIPKSVFSDNNLAEELARDFANIVKNAKKQREES